MMAKELLLLLGALMGFPACLPRSEKLGPDGVIVLLNGTSSSGKTAIIDALQRAYGQFYEVANIDRFISVYESEHPLSDESDKKAMTLAMRRERTRKMLDAFYLAVKQRAAQGKNMLVDVVQFDDDYEKNCARLGHEMLAKILVYCPLDVIVQRVKKRTDEGDPRWLNLVFEQFAGIYKLQCSVSDVVVDHFATTRITTQLPVLKAEAARIPKEVGLSPEDTWAFNRERMQFLNDFVKQFKLDGLQEIVLTTKHQWDLIVNTSNTSAEVSAKTIAAYLEKRWHLVPPAPVKTDPALFMFNQYVGRYRFRPDFVFNVTKDADILFGQGTGQGKVELHPKGADRFFNQIDEFEITFVRDAAGKVAKLVLRQGGADQVAERF